MWDYLYTNSRNTVAVDDVDLLLVSVNNHNVTQELRLEGELKELLLFCSAPSGAAYQDATVSFCVQQGDIVYQETVYAKEISGTYKVTLPRLKFSEGSAQLIITGENYPEGTDLFLMVSQTDKAGLSFAYMDENPTPGPLLMHYTVMRHDGYFVYDTVMLCLLVLTILLISWVIIFKKQKAEESKLLFACSMLLLFVYISLRNPMATFLAEPRSEMAYEFWYKAKYMSLPESMMSLMSGESLVWTERLMMWIAVQLAGDGKYVFVIAQIMQTLLVCGVSSMLCLPTFKRWFPAEVRLLVCWYLGGAMLFPSAYYFWAVSYWACFFLIPFGFVDMEKMKRWQYVLAMVATVILCVSRIYHILYIPMALLALFALGKARGKRFSWYCIIIAVASAFEVLYSMTAGGGGHIDLSLLKPMQFLDNAVYYQVQVLCSMFMGKGIWNDSMTNFVFLCFFIGVFLSAVWLGFVCWKDIRKRSIGIIVMLLGILSFGSVLINITVCGCSASVAFPINYAAPVDWNVSYYQNGDLHFSYSYFSIVAIILILCGTKRESRCLSEVFACKQTTITALLVLLLTCVNVQEYVAMRMIETSWKSSYSVTDNSSYYMPINVVYPVADISLYHNASSIICGMTDNGEETLWTPQYQAYSLEYDYQKISPGKVSDLKNREMLALSARKNHMNFADLLVMILRDENGVEIQRVTQTNTPDRYRADFMLEEPVSGVYSIEFQYEDGRPAYVREGVQIGVALGEAGE